MIISVNRSMHRVCFSPVKYYTFRWCTRRKGFAVSRGALSTYPSGVWNSSHSNWFIIRTHVKLNIIRRYACRYRVAHTKRVNCKHTCTLIMVKQAMVNRLPCARISHIIRYSANMPHCNTADWNGRIRETFVFRVFMNYFFIGFLSSHECVTRGLGRLLKRDERIHMRRTSNTRGRSKMCYSKRCYA